MTTNARTHASEASHFYTADAQPLYEIARADGKGMRKFTLADARKMDPKPLPSVTTVLKLLHKQALVDWLCEQTALACLTTPRKAGIKCTKCDWDNPHLTYGVDTSYCDRCGAPAKEAESLDEFVYRVLHDERVQDQEAQTARDRGTEIHAALEDLFCGKPISAEIEPWVRPAFDAVCKYGELACTERILVGEGYAGKTDLIQQGKDDYWWLWDWKSAKKLPDPAKGGAWSEHRLQASAYAKAWEMFNAKTGYFRAIRTGNIYISTVDCGKFVVCEHPDWQETYRNGFAPLVKHWMWATGYIC